MRSAAMVPLHLDWHVGHRVRLEDKLASICRFIARSDVDTLATLAEITAKEPHLSGQPFLTLTEQLLAFLITYEPEKKRIPTKSRWYAQRYSHPDWYHTGDSETSLAHQTGSGL